MLKVWGRKTSSNVQALMWCIGELGLACQRFDVGHKYGGNDTPEFLAMNPNGTVPVIRDGEMAALWETGAILRYLAGRYANPEFWPQEPTARAEVDQWAEWAKVNIALNFTAPLFWRVVRTPERERDIVAIDAALLKLNSKLAIAEVQLQQHDFLVGEHFTLADIQFGHLLYRYFDIDITRPSYPAITAYYQRLTCRAAFVEHVMIAYDELRA